MKIIGITGGVGSGKSVVLSALSERYNAYIIEADKLAHELMQPDMPIFNKIVAEFGTDILAQDGTIDRKRLGEIVFSDKTRLEALNNISHPTVKEEILRQIEDKKAENDTELFVIEAALLIQDGYKSICDEIWYIYAEKDTRVKRIMESRGYSYEKCAGMLKSQPADDYYIDNSERVIDNNGNTDELYAKLDAIIVELHKSKL